MQIPAFTKHDCASGGVRSRERPAAGCVVLHRSALAATWRWLGPTPCRFGGRQLGFFHNLGSLGLWGDQVGPCKQDQQTESLRMVPSKERREPPSNARAARSRKGVALGDSLTQTTKTISQTTAGGGHTAPHKVASGNWKMRHASPCGGDRRISPSGGRPMQRRPQCRVPMRHATTNSASHRYCAAFWRPIIRRMKVCVFVSEDPETSLYARPRGAVRGKPSVP